MEALRDVMGEKLSNSSAGAHSKPKTFRVSRQMAFYAVFYDAECHIIYALKAIAPP